jgi:dynein heavy chain
LFDSCTKNLEKGEEESRDDFLAYMEKWFVFSLIWSVCATVDENSRKNIDNVMRDIEAMFPHTNTVFEYYINLEKKDWAPWEEKLTSSLKPKGKEFHEIMVPTVDTVRNRFVCEKLIDKNSQILFIGESGVGKTVLVEGVLTGLDALVMSFVINFSAGSSSEGLQSMIESYYDRRAKNKFMPKNSKTKAVCFIDDLNMPKKDTYGSQPPLELIR